MYKARRLPTLALCLLIIMQCQGLSRISSLRENQIRTVEAEPTLPLYWGWFPNLPDSFSFLQISKQIIEDALRDIPEFLRDAERFTGQSGVENILQNYTREVPTNGLHCTAMYNGVWPNYTAGAVDYSRRPEVLAAVGRPFIIHSVGWIFTPRSFGARLKLRPKQLILWNSNDSEGNPSSVDEPQPARANVVGPVTSFQGSTEQQLRPVPQDPDILGNFKPTKGIGSRAHFTLGNSPGVSAVTTGWDLVDIIRLEQAEVPAATYNISSGWLRNYGDGNWVIYPRMQYLLSSIFRGGQA